MRGPGLVLLIGLASQESSPVATAEALLEAGDLEAAAEAIRNLPFPTKDRLQGRLELERGAPDRAAAAFMRARAAVDVDDPALVIHLAHAQLLAEAPRAALRTLDGLSEAGQAFVAGPLIAARAHRAVGENAQAYDLLHEAVAAFPHEVRPRLELMALCRDLELMREARRQATKVLAAPTELETLEGLALFDLLAEDDEALALLERVAARFPRSAEVKARLASAYAGRRRWLAAARLFEAATQLGGNFAFEAADQYRMAGRHRQALRLSHQVADPDRRRAQRWTVLFEAGAYARVVARPDPPTDRASQYRQAYAHYALGHRDRAATLARKLLQEGGPEDAIAPSAGALLEALGLSAEGP